MYAPRMLAAAPLLPRASSAAPFCSFTQSEFCCPWFSAAKPGSCEVLPEQLSAIRVPIVGEYRNVDVAVPLLVRLSVAFTVKVWAPGAAAARLRSVGAPDGGAE